MKSILNLFAGCSCQSSGEDLARDDDSFHQCNPYHLGNFSYDLGESFC